METRQFGSTDLRVSVIGFGAWAIGGAAMAGSTPIGWGPSDDRTSLAALRRALDLGIDFYDTADFYGLGKSERLVGRAFGNSDRVVIATKVGHRIGKDGGVFVDYSARHIRKSCDGSLRRLRRDSIDYYQLHTARLEHLEAGDCIEEMERLRAAGKIRYWGLSLNTFHPEPEAAFLLDRGLGSGFQLVLNVLNRRALPVIERARAAGMGVIVRMPLQFGLLTGSVRRGQTFPPDDHRSFRLDTEIIDRSLDLLDLFWREVGALGLTPTQAALSYVAAVPGVSTIIPGIRTPEQAELDAAGVTPLPGRVKVLADALPANAREDIVKLMEARG